MHDCVNCHLVRTVRLPDAEWDAEAEVPSSSVTSRCSSFCMQSQAASTSRSACRQHRMFTSSFMWPVCVLPGINRAGLQSSFSDLVAIVL